MLTLQSTQDVKVINHTLLVVCQEVLNLCVHLLTESAGSEGFHPHIGTGDGGTHDACMQTRILPAVGS